MKVFILVFLPVGFRPARIRAMQASVVGSMEASHDSLITPKNERRATMARQPVHEIRRGLIVVRIWNKRSRNTHRYSTSIVRLFRNGSDWKESARFGPEDIPVMRLALDDAHTWLLTHEAEVK